MKLMDVVMMHLLVKNYKYFKFKKIVKFDKKNGKIIVQSGVLLNDLIV